MARFPDGFLWGVATAAHQVEGNNVGSDAWLREHLPGFVYREPSGDAADFYHRYPDDIAVIAVIAVAPNARVDVTLSLQEIASEPGGEETANAADEFVNRRYLRAMGAVGDFIGVQTYTRIVFGPDGMKPPTGRVSDNGLELAPGALTATCRQAQEITGLPVLVTEHGVDFDDADDDVRATLIEDTLRVLAPAIADGLDVRGYLHWSLVDNFEWFNGYHGHFGLLANDRATQRRWIRPSAIRYGSIARANASA